MSFNASRSFWLSCLLAVALPGCSLIVGLDPNDIQDGGGGGTTPATGGQGGVPLGGGPLGGGGASQGGGGNEPQGGGGGEVGGAGGSGGPECAQPTECPGVDTECRSRTCDAGVCDFENEAPGVALATQTPGDCLEAVCDGAGATETQNDDDDIFDDSNDCTADTCDGGSVTNDPLPLGTACTSNNGAVCNLSGDCVECNDGTDCASGICTLEQCVPASCADTTLNGNETDTDCGGTDCSPCADGDDCMLSGDCQSGVCTATVCQTPLCNDGVENGNETDLDCGGANCQPCGPGEGCIDDGDCVGGDCSGTTCLPTCTDGVTNAGETDTDCGGPTCGGCDVGDTCSIGSDCLSLSCQGTLCAASACNDSAQNGAETDVDCGGGTCPDCGDGDGCLLPGDCTSGVCTGNVCGAASCGDSVVQAGETCDDGDTTSGDGCSSGCATELGFNCTGMPSVCTTTCGDNVRASTEACDDGDTTALDGCSATCTVELGWVCTGNPSTCTATCGDGIVVSGEGCDDNGLATGDGCSSTCTVEPGYTCLGSPSVCTAGCGDGIVTGTEACDDGNNNPNDGCSAACVVEAGFSCAGSPSACSTTCGDSIIAGAETCDDSDAVGGDGCSATCLVEPGFTCIGTPSVCSTSCGDSIIAGAETCDDGDATGADGCSATCTVETGFACVGQPSVCGPICGDGVLLGGEVCDDGNVANGDCCSSGCTIEAGCEVEPNNACGSQNVITLAGSPATGTVKGAVNPGTDFDFYSFTLPAASSVRLETYIGTPGTCGSITSNDTHIELRGTTCTTVLAANDDTTTNWCSLIDPTTTTAARNLAAGTYSVRVKHSSTGVIPTYMLAVSVLASCGDGIIGPFESCDDSNQTSGDGCSSLCKIEFPTETEANNTCATANGPIAVPSGAAGVVRAGSIAPAADADWYSFTIPVRADVRFETFDANGPSTCAAIDTVIQAFASDCTTPLGAAQDQGGVSNCSRIDPSNLAYARQLAPGTYNVRVNAFSASATFNYTLQVRMTSECGNGVTEGFEQCDGGATCDANCVLLPVCGNGLLQAGETCDDGNTTDSDGCSSACATEAGYACAGTPGVCGPVCGQSTTIAPETCDDGNTLNGDACDAACTTEVAFTEIEPNGTVADADTNATNGLEITAASAIISGAVTPTGDLDFFKMTLATPQAVRLETFDGSGNDCTALNVAAAMRLTVFAANGTTQLYDDTTSGIGNCSAIVANFAAGTYYVRVQKNTAGTIAAYRLQVKMQSSRGNESEANETTITADGLTGSDVYVFGGHLVNADLDTFAVNVPAGKDLRIETIEGGAETCESSGIDSRLRLLSPTGTDLGSDDDAGRGFCSLIDGSGATPLSAFASNLPGGTYFIRVEASNPAGVTAAGQFDYRLVVTIR